MENNPIHQPISSGGTAPIKDPRRKSVFSHIYTACAILGIPLAELKRMVEDGRVPGIRVSKMWMVNVDEVAATLNQIAAKESKERASKIE